MDDAMNRIVLEAVRASRDNTLQAAIEICEEFARSGHDAECCARALRDFRDMLPKAPSTQQ